MRNLELENIVELAYMVWCSFPVGLFPKSAKVYGEVLVNGKFYKLEYGTYVSVVEPTMITNSIYDMLLIFVLY